MLLSGYMFWGIWSKVTVALMTATGDMEKHNDGDQQ